jgi:gamma-glutamyltranspeptidase / glutathione hydrolase
MSASIAVSIDRGLLVFTFQSMASTKGNTPVIGFGILGCGFQPLGHVQIVMNIVYFSMNLQEAGDPPRISHTGPLEPTVARMTDCGTVLMESGFPCETTRALMRKGRRVRFGDGIHCGSSHHVRRQ